MPDKQQFEIPEAVREIAERNVQQVRSAYGQFMDMARQAQDLVMKSQGAMAASALEIQQRAMRYTEQNIDASFNFASEVARAKDLKDYLAIQQRYAQKQVQTYTQQAQEIGKLLAEAAQKVQTRG